ncbi:class I SAM-dependent methyltransferase [Nocardia crassostreae]|uniref:class I SAM-dependent methyltransferase n=1 Tax=Nocardia crassostreae TaxID=53428 RepID=UPI0008296749|nr:class I SAM-dependent methyltransferase [Nocardia crassostreae]
MTEVDDVRATRDAYNGVAELYTSMFRDHLATSPFDRAMLEVFAAHIREGAPGPVADLGCGPGRLTTYLRDLGLEVFGLDLSPEMIRLARIDHPGIRFDVGSMEQLDLDDAALSGIVAWYSIIHTPPERVPAVLTEFARVLRPGGHILFGFQAPDARDGVQQFDHKVTPGYRWAPDTLAETLNGTGFRTIARLIREPRPDERFQQACLLAVRD